MDFSLPRYATLQKLIETDIALCPIKVDNIRAMTDPDYIAKLVKYIREKGGEIIYDPQMDTYTYQSFVMNFNPLQEEMEDGLKTP